MPASRKNEFRIECEERRNLLIFEIHGDLIDANDIHAIDDFMLNRTETRVIIVLEDVGYMNSSGFSGIILLADHLKERNVRMMIVGLNRNVQIVFNSLGASDVIETYPTIDVAIKAAND